MLRQRKQREVLPSMALTIVKLT